MNGPPAAVGPTPGSRHLLAHHPAAVPRRGYTSPGQANQPRPPCQW